MAATITNYLTSFVKFLKTHPVNPEGNLTLIQSPEILNFTTLSPFFNLDIILLLSFGSDLMLAAVVRIKVDLVSVAVTVGMGVEEDGGTSSLAD